MTTTSEILWRVAWMVLGREPGAGEVPPEAQLPRDFDPYGETGREANLYLHTLWPRVNAITHPLYPLVAAWLDRRKRARIRDG